MRENLADLYGNVNNYDGRPAQTQIDRTDAITRELADVVKDFDGWVAKELPGINSALSAKHLNLIQPLRRAEWEKP